MSLFLISLNSKYTDRWQKKNYFIKFLFINSERLVREGENALRSANGTNGNNCRAESLFWAWTYRAQNLERRL